TIVAGTTVLMSIPIAFGNRFEMAKSYYVQGQKTVLWDFLKYLFAGLPFGLILGLWWAGEGRRFNISRVITFFYGLLLTLICWTGLLWFLFFLIYKGVSPSNPFASGSNLTVIPPWLHGFRSYIFKIESFDMLSLLVLPLLLGAPTRIRDFWKRSLLIPLAFLCALPIFFTSPGFWNCVQHQFTYQRHSADVSQKAAAYKHINLILKRYPRHHKWPVMADKLAGFYYKEGQYDKAKALYQEIIDKYSDSYKFYWRVISARTMLKNKKFGTAFSGVELQIPMIDYETYLTHNWMSVLSVIRYWEGPDRTESEVKIKLKTLSLTTDKIGLNPLTSLAHVDDAVRSLGYECLILPAELDTVKDLISARVPIIYNNYRTLEIIFGFDQTRSVLYGYDFEHLSKRIKKEARKESKEILAIKKEGQGKTKDLLTHIANEAYFEHPI
ncbi:MAG: hypothetical protein KAX15_01075, partial [Candidatus Omnitrophica bacterium]|nr:hypothetical protein [Candidatus Omnitrophota bacterium]